MRRRPGTLLPLELAICAAAIDLWRHGTGEFHGYQIAKHLGTVAESRVLTGYGTVYRALGRLESMKLMQSRWEDPAIPARENRPGRRLYTLTASGVAAVAEARRAAAERSRHRRPRRKAVRT